MNEIYDFVGKSRYEHNFENVEQVILEDDDIYGFVNLHKIQSKVGPIKSQVVEILGKN